MDFCLLPALVFTANYHLIPRIDKRQSIYYWLLQKRCGGKSTQRFKREAE